MSTDFYENQDAIGRLYESMTSKYFKFYNRCHVKKLVASNRLLYFCTFHSFILMTSIENLIGNPFIKVLAILY